MDLPVSGESMPVSLPWEPSPFLSEPSLPFQGLPPTALLWAQWAQLSVLELVMGFLDPPFPAAYLWARVHLLCPPDLYDCSQGQM